MTDPKDSIGCSCLKYHMLVCFLNSSFTFLCMCLQLLVTITIYAPLFHYQQDSLDLLNVMIELTGADPGFSEGGIRIRNEYRGVGLTLVLYL